MDIGMLWYDDDGKRTLAQKIERAVEYYRAKYGAVPTECHINPTLMDPQVKTAGGCTLHGNRTIIKNHFWLGVAAGAQLPAKFKGK